MPCSLSQCFSPIACASFGYCRELNVRHGMPSDAVAAEWRAAHGIQPDPAAAGMVADVAVLIETYGDDFFEMKG